MSAFSDRELLELAAKAAKLDIGWSVKRTQVGQPDMYGVREYTEAVCPIMAGVFWNPLTDDGDAQRLLNELQLSLRHTGGGTVIIRDRHGREICYENYRGDIDAATRRAIVRAAAEVGKKL